MHTYKRGKTLQRTIENPEVYFTYTIEQPAGAWSYVLIHKGGHDRTSLQ